MGGFSAGLACGIGCGMVMGMGTGHGSGRASAHKELRKLVDKGKIKITDSNGASITGADLVSLLSNKVRRK
jgi:hypothetical protein